MRHQLVKSLRLIRVLLIIWRDDSRLNTALWLQRACIRISHVLGIDLIVEGTLPSQGLIVANHLGYLDVIALGSILPCRFVAKADVARWPVFGAMARRGGTVFINREKRSDVVSANTLLVSFLSQPICMVIFPEGTSSDGSSVLPFYPSLLEPAIFSDCPVTPLRISYHLSGADAGRCMAYHGDMTLIPHLWNLLRYNKMQIRLTFGPTRHLRSPRKSAAKILRHEIDMLAEC